VTASSDEGRGIILARVGLGADETMLLGNVGRVLLAAPIKKCRRVGMGSFPL
jgi:hypothetical protein